MYTLYRSCSKQQCLNFICRMGKDYCPSGKLVDVNVSMIFNHVFLVFTPDRNFVMNIGILTEHMYLDTFILLCVDIEILICQ